MEEGEARDAKRDDASEESDCVGGDELGEGYKEGDLEGDGSVDGGEAFGG